LGWGHGKVKKRTRQKPRHAGTRTFVTTGPPPAQNFTSENVLLTPRHKQKQTLGDKVDAAMRLFYTVLLLIFLSDTTVASQDTQAPRASTELLTNADVLDMLHAGLSQEIVIAKIGASTCKFDTSPAALKGLKAMNVSDAVILAMVQAPIGPRGQEPPNGEPSVRVRIDCSHTDPVPVYSAPRTSDHSGPDSIEVSKVKCGDTITLLNPADKQSWLRIRTSDGQVGYVSAALVSKEQRAESTQGGHASSESKKRENIQRANDDLEDCRVRSQNEYYKKVDALNSLALAPMVRVAAAGRLRQNLDAELRQCRSQYESRLKAIDGE
jgi:hypothetical protein